MFLAGIERATCRRGDPASKLATASPSCGGLCYGPKCELTAVSVVLAN